MVGFGGRLSVAVWLVAGLVLSGSNAASSSAATGSLVLPLDAEQQVRVSAAVGDEYGVAYQRSADPKPGNFYATFDGQQDVPIPGLYVPDQMVGTRIYDAEARWVDVTTGQTGTLPLVDPRANEFLGATGDGGWLAYGPRSGSAQFGILRYAPDGSETAAYSNPPVDYEQPGDKVSPIPLEIDTSGAVFWVLGERSDPTAGRVPDAIDYLDYASGTFTELARNTGNPAGALDDSWVAWCAGVHTLAWAPRANPAAVATRSVSCNAVALNGDNVAVTGQVKDASGVVHRVVTSGAVQGPLVQTSFALPLFQVYRGQGGGFSVMGGNSGLDAGFYRLVAGSTTVGQSVVRIGDGPPYFLWAEPGRVLTEQSLPARPVAQRTITRNSDGTLSYGRASSFVPTIGRDDDLSASWGPYLAQLRRTNPPTVVIRDATHVVQRVTLPRHTYADVHLSGRRLLVASSGAAYVVDLLTGHRTLVPEAHALWGDRIAYVKHGGEVRVRDVVTGHETVIRRAGGYTGAVREATLAMWGDWVTYSLPTSSGGVLDMTAVNVVSGKRVRIHGTGSSWNFVGVFTVSDGYVAWVEGHTGAVHLVRLSDGTDRVVGNIVHGYDGAWIGLTDEFITWVDRDARTHVLTIPNLSAAPRALGTYSPASFSPNGDGHNDTWRFATQLSRPLTSWTLTVRSPAGTIMRKLSGNGAAGSVVTTWDGRDTSGHRAPAGTYRWTLAGRGPAGQLRPLRGGTLTGQFTLSH